MGTISPSLLSSSEQNGISTETEPPFPQSFSSDDSDDSGESVTLRPNRFRPDAGTRNRLRNRLHEVLENSEDSNTDPSSDERTSTRNSQNAARPNIASIPRQRNTAIITESATESVTLKPLEYV